MHVCFFIIYRLIVLRQISLSLRQTTRVWALTVDGRVVSGRRGALDHRILEILVTAEVERVRGSSPHDHRRHAPDRPEDAFVPHHPEEGLDDALAARRRQRLHPRL